MMLYPYQFRPQAHRGRSAVYPQNTVRAFEAAGKQPFVYGIETDVHITKDGVPVCFHDATLDALTTGTGVIADYTLAEVQEFVYDNTAGADLYPGETIPKLEDYLKVCRKYGKVPYIEVKFVKVEQVPLLLQTVRRMGFEDRCIFTGFSWPSLAEIRRLTDGYFLEAMFTEGTTLEKAMDTVRDCAGVALRFYCGDVTEELVNAAHEHGYLVDAWGLAVGDRAMLERLIDAGAEGCTCNDYTFFYGE